MSTTVRSMTEDAHLTPAGSTVSFTDHPTRESHMGPQEPAYEAQSNRTENLQYRPNFSQAHGSIPRRISDAVVSEMPPQALRLPAPCRHGGVRDALPLLAFLLLLPALLPSSATHRSAPPTHSAPLYISQCPLTAACAPSPAAQS
jgi:hypothetical protein